MDEKTWWDFWNTSHRSEVPCDSIASELFSRVAVIVNEITADRGFRILEIACGAGLLSRQLNFSNYHGLDISPAAIDMALHKQGHEPSHASAGPSTYEVADFHAWPLPAELFDLALCVDAIAYFRDQRLALRKMANSLHAGGKLVLTTINPFVYQRIKRTAANPLEEGSVSRWLSRSELHDLIQSAGLTIERSYTIMPRGDSGILRLINARRVNQAFGTRGAAILRRFKEHAQLGQYRVVVARKA